MTGVGLGDGCGAGQGGTNAKGQGAGAQPSLDTECAVAPALDSGSGFSGHFTSPVDVLSKPVGGLTATILPIFRRLG